jgi:hypothetical protein
MELEPVVDLSFSILPGNHTTMEFGMDFGIIFAAELLS